MRVYFLMGAGGFAPTAVRAASRLWSAPGAPFTPARIESPAGTILEKARILRCGLLSVLHQTVSREGYLHQTVLSQLKRELPFLPIIAALSANPFVYAATASITGHLIFWEQFLAICTFEPSPIGSIIDRLASIEVFVLNICQTSSPILFNFFFTVFPVCFRADSLLIFHFVEEHPVSRQISVSNALSRR